MLDPGDAGSVTAEQPTVSSVELTSDPNDDMRMGNDATYAIGDAVQATVTFNEAVDITGTPQLDLDFRRHREDRRLHRRHEHDDAGVLVHGGGERHGP